MEQSADLYAAWQEVFDNARPVEIQPDTSSADQRHADAGHEAAEPTDPFAAHQRVNFASLSADGSKAEGVAPISQSPATSLAMPAVVASGVSTSRIERAANADGAAPSPRVTTPAAFRTGTAFDTESASFDAGRSAARPQDVAQHAAPASEFVSVFQHGAGVTVVVRDSTLSETEAMRCAFEAARELTGKRSSLQQVTVNGRVLYEQQSPAPDAAPGSATFAFAC